MAFDKAKMARSLKILATTPAEIERQQKVYREKLAEIKAEEAKGIWGRVTLDNRRKEATADRNRTCNALTRQMREALNFVAENNAYSESETIDFENRKLQDALRTVEYMGDSLSYADQAAILNLFKGDVGALRVLEKAYAKNKLYLKDAAHEMQKAIPDEAIRQMDEVLSFAAYAEAKGEFNFPIDRAIWTKGAFQKQLDRLGLNSDADVYDAVLDALADKIREGEGVVNETMTEEEKQLESARQQAQLWKLTTIKQELKNAQQNGDNPAAVLNRVLAKFEGDNAINHGAGANS